MRRSLNKLSAKAIDHLSDAGRFSDGGGLYLYVRKSGSKSWVFRYSRNGKRRDLGFGPYPSVSLKDAREKAAQARSILIGGRDPIEHLSAPGADRESRLSFGEFAIQYVDEVTKNFRNAKHRQQWRNSLVSYCSDIWNKPIADVDTIDVLNVLRPIWVEKGETARRVRSRMEAVLSAAELEGLRSEGRNPAQWKGFLEHHKDLQAKPRRSHHASMDFHDVPQFYGELAGRDAMAARALQFLILTASRSNEVLGARWEEIHLGHAVWTIPADRMKAGQEHRVPLSRQSIEIIKPLHAARMSKWVFPGLSISGRLSTTSLSNLMKKRMGYEGVTIHGFRTSFRTWCAEIDRADRDLAEAALAHKIENKVERAYNRSDLLDLRRNLMQRWASFCSERAQGENVYSLF